jgi:hypothetical protein
MLCAGMVCVLCAVMCRYGVCAVCCVQLCAGMVSVLCAVQSITCCHTTT